jgi:hypothetical protein
MKWRDVHIEYENADLRSGINRIILRRSAGLPPSAMPACSKQLLALGCMADKLGVEMFLWNML